MQLKCQLILRQNLQVYQFHRICLSRGHEIVAFEDSFLSCLCVSKMLLIGEQACQSKENPL